jgi:hypothetical protein
MKKKLWGAENRKSTGGGTLFTENGKNQKYFLFHKI